EGGDRTTSAGVGSDDESNRRRRGCGFACLCRRNAAPYDRGDLPVHEIGRQSQQPILLIIRPAILDGDVFAFDESSVIQALPKGINSICEAGSRGASEKSDHRHRLLRTRTPRLGREQQTPAPDQSNKLTAFYVEHGDFLPLCLLTRRPARSVGLLHAQIASERRLGSWGRRELF